MSHKCEQSLDGQGARARMSSKAAIQRSSKTVLDVGKEVEDPNGEALPRVSKCLLACNDELCKHQGGPKLLGCCKNPFMYSRDEEQGNGG